MGDVFSVVAGADQAHPYLRPPSEKERLLERLHSSETVRKQFDSMKVQAAQGKFVEAALVFALEGDRKSFEVGPRAFAPGAP